MIKAIKSIGTSISPLIKDGDIVLYEEFKFPMFPDVTCLDMTSERCGGKITSLYPFLERGGNPPLISPLYVKI